MKITDFSYRRLTKVPVGIFAAFLLSSSLQSCFTGIESTPKITYKESAGKDNSGSPERVFAQDFKAVPFSKWEPGRRFLVSDNKSRMAYLPTPGKGTSVTQGDTLLYTGIREIPAITGGKVAELIFLNNSSSSDTLFYRPGGDIETLRSRGNVMLPFVVDLDLVEEVAGTLVGKELYTRTDRWQSSAGLDIKGKKFLKIRINSVSAANEIYPFLIGFSSLEEDGLSGYIQMSVTVEGNTPALRGFENLFLLNDPRPAYTTITDSTWELIRQGKVAEGMTTREASLSLGTPREIDRRHDQSLQYERWSYPDGIYLIFEDGVLVRYNL